MLNHVYHFLMSIDKNKLGFYYLMAVMGTAFVIMIVMLVKAYLG